MERPLQILHLHQDFPYRRMDGIEESAPSTDVIRVYDLGPLVAAGPEGPRLLSAPPSPPLLSRNDGATASRKGDFVLLSGDWVFRQRDDAAEAEMPAILEAFLRDCWWEGRSSGDRIIARRVREDGKTALQLWSRIGE